MVWSPGTQARHISGASYSGLFWLSLIQPDADDTPDGELGTGGECGEDGIFSMSDEINIEMSLLPVYRVTTRYAEVTEDLDIQMPHQGRLCLNAPVGVLAVDRKSLSKMEGVLYLAGLAPVPTGAQLPGRLGELGDMP